MTFLSLNRYNKQYVKTLTLISECDGSIRNASAAFWSQVRAVVACNSNSDNLSRNTGMSRPCTMRSSTCERSGRIDSCYTHTSLCSTELIHITTTAMLMKMVKTGWCSLTSTARLTESHQQNSNYHLMGFHTGRYTYITSHQWNHSESRLWLHCVQCTL